MNHKLPYDKRQTYQIGDICRIVHAAGAVYCKECWYYTEWGECKEFGEIMKPDEFCSRGVMKNGETY